jgi:hypothetical protein
MDQVSIFLIIFFFSKGYEHHDTDELIPNLEFESALYKLFYDLDAYPIILNSKKLDSVEKVISVIDNLSPVYKVTKYFFTIDVSFYWSLTLKC